MVGILIRTRIGMDVYGTNTRLENAPLGDFDPATSWKWISASNRG